MDLPLFSALFAGFSLMLYVLLDGFDLGVGALLLLQKQEKSRDNMIDSITPTWDGNETWLIMTGVTLLAGFPIAYGILMPAFYVPLVIMLLALGLRGVSFEFRSQTKGYQRHWDVVFGVGSIVTACMQGLILGGLIQGVTIRGEAFTGSVFDCLRPFPLLCAACVLSGYMMLGGCWLYLKTTGISRDFAARALRSTLIVFLMAFGVACFTAASVQPAVQSAWGTHTASLTTIVGLMSLAAVALFCQYRQIGRTPTLVRRTCCHRPRNRGPGYSRLSRRRTVPALHMAGLCLAPQPRFPVNRRGLRHAGRAYLLCFCLLGLSG